MGTPHGSPPVGSRGKALVGVWSPRSHICIYICSGQTHFRDVFIEDIRCTFRLMWSLLPRTLLLQKTSNLCKSHDPPVTHRGYATATVGRVGNCYVWQGEQTENQGGQTKKFFRRFAPNFIKQMFAHPGLKPCRRPCLSWSMRMYIVHYVVYIKIHRSFYNFTYLSTLNYVSKITSFYVTS